MGPIHGDWDKAFWFFVKACVIGGIAIGLSIPYVVIPVLRWLISHVQIV